MKKVLVVVAALAMVSAFTSCKKTCTCTESATGVSQKIEIDSKYTCADVEATFDIVSEEEGEEWQTWTCK